YFSRSTSGMRCTGGGCRCARSFMGKNQRVLPIGCWGLVDTIAINSTTLVEGGFFGLIISSFRGMALYALSMVFLLGEVVATNTVGFNLPILQPVSISSGPIVNVSQFGAVGDGRTNDTAAIQSALNYIRANGGTLNFEAGHTYIVSRSLAIA